MTVVIVVSVVVATLTINLGPSLRALAEREGSKSIDRPLHIGRRDIHLLSGKFRLMDLRIDGLHPGDRAFFTAKQIDLAMDWRPAFRRRPEFMITGVELSDWQMLVEKWDGGDNFPKFRKDDDQETGPKRF